MRKQFLYAVVTVVLVLILAGSVCGIVLGKTQHTGEAEHTAAYQILEEIYVEQVREVLKQEGLSSAGVTLTYERDREGFRSYTLEIHHHRFAGLQPQQIAELEKEMEALFFDGKDCDIKMQFWA